MKNSHSATTDPIAHPTSHESKGLTNQIVHKILFQLESGAYPPGTRIPSIPKLASEYKASTGTLHNALQRLVLMNMLKTYPKKRGYFVPKSRAHPQAASISSMANIRFPILDHSSRRVHNETLRESCRPFQHQHSNYNLEFKYYNPTITYSGYNDYLEKSLSTKPDGSKPDLTMIYCGFEFIRTHAERRIIANIQPYLQDWDYLNQIHDVAWEPFCWNDGIFGIPFHFRFPCLLVHKPTMRTMLGIADDEIKSALATWENIERLKHESSLKGDLERFQVHCDYFMPIIFLWQHLMLQHGHHPFNGSPIAHPSILDGESIRALDQIKNWIGSGLICKNPWKNGGEYVQCFKAGYYPIRFTFRLDHYIGYLAHVKFPLEDLMIIPLPTWRGGESINLAYSSGYVFSADAEEPDLIASVELMKHLLQKQVYHELKTKMAIRDTAFFTDVELYKDSGLGDIYWPPVPAQWKEQFSTMLKNPTACPSAPYWTPDVFENTIETLFKNPQANVQALLAEHLQVRSFQPEILYL